jgi:hypothetical protein
MRTVIVDIDFDVDIGGVDSTGKEWRAVPAELTRQRSDQALSPFPHTHYVGKLFEWRIQVGPSDFGYFFRSNTGEPVCFKFGQAGLTSSFEQNTKPMRIKWARYGPRGGEIKVLQAAKNQTETITPPTICAMPDKGSTVGLVLDLSSVFPSGQMFNINQSGKSLDFSERGRDNWIKISVPVEHAGKRELVEVRLTGRDSKARNSYH